MRHKNGGDAPITDDATLGDARLDDATLAAAEIARFNALAAQWWNPAGPMAPLHAMNPARIGWITQAIAARFGADAKPEILDIGCGAGLAAEALARRGFPVLGVDAAEELVAVATEHAEGQGLTLGYRHARAEELLAEGRRFTVITALELIEHIPDPGAFLRTLASLLAPGGQLYVSTLNRTRRAWLVAIFGAEYVARMLPVGTHQWRAFIAPVELAALGRAAGLRLADTTGLNPAGSGWRTGGSLAVNYIARLEN